MIYIFVRWETILWILLFLSLFAFGQLDFLKKNTPVVSGMNSAHVRMKTDLTSIIL